MKVAFRKIEGGFWRAFLPDADHVGGTGVTPEEALGWLCFNHPQRMGVGEFTWKDRPPKNPQHDIPQYPRGMQEPFAKEASQS